VGVWDLCRKLSVASSHRTVCGVFHSANARIEKSKSKRTFSFRRPGKVTQKKLIAIVLWLAAMRRSNISACSTTTMSQMHANGMQYQRHAYLRPATRNRNTLNAMLLHCAIGKRTLASTA
jgi:hypothetical protein